MHQPQMNVRMKNLKFCVFVSISRTMILSIAFDFALTKERARNDGLRQAMSSSSKVLN